MTANFHTHSTFCDGANTPEEIILEAIRKGFHAIGFSGHGYTAFDLRYCMKDTEGYIAEVTRLKEKYRNDIQVYLGVEEDAFSPVDHSRFDYIISSSHYLRSGDTYYPIDSTPGYFERCIELFGGDVVRMAEEYYGFFSDYIRRVKPDIVGHFDLITKFDQLGKSRLLSNSGYNATAERYITWAAESGSIFEVNTGVVARGLRKRPYPNENLLYALKRVGARLILSSDSHDISTLDFAFEETRKYLKDIGFKSLMTMRDGHFVSEDI